MPCSIEKADERLLLYTLDVSKSFDRVLIKTVDCDVVIIATAGFHKIHSIEELWIEFGKGKSIKFISVHEIVSHLGQLTSIRLIFCHALSGCDTTLSISGKRKISFWDTWKIMSEITSLFPKLSKITITAEITEENYKLIEKSFIVLYSPTTNTDDMNSVWQMWFTHGGRSVENILPTREALKQHILATLLQASMWNKYLNKQRSCHNPTEWGWQKFDEKYILFWINLPDAKTCYWELTKCSFMKSCKGRCNCCKQELQCTELCACAKLFQNKHTYS